MEGSIHVSNGMARAKYRTAVQVKSRNEGALTRKAARPNPAPAARTRARSAGVATCHNTILPASIKSVMRTSLFRGLGLRHLIRHFFRIRAVGDFLRQTFQLLAIEHGVV